MSTRRARRSSGAPRAGRLFGSALAVVMIGATGLLAGCDDEAPSPAASATASPSPTRETPSPEETTPAPTVPAEPTEQPSPTPDATPERAVVLESVTDGDTIRTSAGVVRIIGIDAPERGECGYDEASAAIAAVLRRGAPLALELPEGQNDRDAYDRLLRYVVTEEGIDVGLMQIEAGHAVARFDSADGYPRHPREDEYRAAQIASLDQNGRVVAASCAPTEDPGAPDETQAKEEEEPWYMKYGSCRKLKANTVGDPTGPFDRDNPAEAEIYNWFNYGTGHRGDGDGDGLACE